MFAWVHIFISLLYFFCFSLWSYMYVRVLTSRSIKPVHVPLTACMCVLHCWTHHRIMDTPFSPSHQSADAWLICSTAGARTWRWTPWLAGYHSQSWSSPVCVVTQVCVLKNDDGVNEELSCSFSNRRVSFFQWKLWSCSQLSALGCRKVSKILIMTGKITSKFVLRNNITCVHRPWHNLIMICIGTGLITCKQQQTKKKEETCRANSALPVAVDECHTTHSRVKIVHKTTKWLRSLLLQKNKFQFSNHLPQNSMGILR